MTAVMLLNLTTSVKHNLEECSIYSGEHKEAGNRGRIANRVKQPLHLSKLNSTAFFCRTL